MKGLCVGSLCFTVLFGWVWQASSAQAVTEKYLKHNLKPTLPRLIMTPENELLLKQKIQSDPGVSNMYHNIKLRAEKIQTEPLLKRELEGRRLLGVSRMMLYRINMLGTVYCVEKDPKVLARINDEVKAVCSFPDWNPSHFLDVGEMSLAVALALDWTAGTLPPETIDQAKTSLIEKGIKPSFEKNGNTWWLDASNNWNQVCNGGMVAAALAIAERDPQLAAETISRALDTLQNPLSAYAPDGVYIEGPGYWEYGTKFTVATISMLESAFGTDFGLSESPGFMESAVFRVLTERPNGFYNFSDCPSSNYNNELTLIWFAAKTGDPAFFQKERFLQTGKKMERLAGAALVWLAQYEPTSTSEFPAVWHGRSEKPVVIFTNGADDPRQYYFATVGGKAALSHGNMDGGSFIFELDGVRWGIDCGNQRYYDLEKIGFDLWSMGQNSPRWTLLTKNNFGHSTLTINGQNHFVDGNTELVDFKDGLFPRAVFDMTPTFGWLAKSVLRKFIKDSPVSLVIEDEIVPTEKTAQVVWQFLTAADVTIIPEGALLKAKEKQLKLQNLSHPDIALSVVSLDPPPLKVDRHIKNLKRVELRVPVSDTGNDVNIKIRLSGGE